MKYIPQAAPFIMVDAITSIDEKQTSTSFEIKADNIFVDEQGFFSEAGLVENMAQTAAAGTGYNADKTGAPPPVGFIGQVKNLNILRLAKVGEILQTRIEQKHQVMNAFIIEGTISVNETIIASAEYKIFLQE